MRRGFGQAARNPTPGMTMSTLYIHTDTEFREATDDEVTSHPAVTAHLPELENERTPRSIHVRHLLVTYYRELRIKGRWLERAGFSIGSRVSVRVLRKRLIIDVEQEPRAEALRHERRNERSGSLA
jgi:hypothetical protein